MALLASGMALAMMAVRVTALLALVMVSQAPTLVLALGLALLPPLALPALAPVGTRAQRLERTRRREPDEASGLVRGWRRQLPLLQGAVAAAEA